MWYFILGYLLASGPPKFEFYDDTPQKKYRIVTEDGEPYGCTTGLYLLEEKCSK